MEKLFGFQLHNGLLKFEKIAKECEECGMEDCDCENCDCEECKKASDAWTRSEGKNPEGGLNAKGRSSYNKATGGNLKPPVSAEAAEKSPAKAKRRSSFCSRMCGMKSKRTGSDTANDPNSRINKALRKWDCSCKTANSTGLRALAGLGLGGLLGGGLGAGAGALREAFSVKSEKAQYLRRALQGMGLGSLVGAGVGASVGAGSLGEKIQNALLEQGHSAHLKVLQGIVDDLNSVKIENLPPFINQPKFSLDPSIAAKRK